MGCMGWMRVDMGVWADVFGAFQRWVWRGKMLVGGGGGRGCVRL